MDRRKETTAILGTFQPWHRGHTELFKREIAKTGQVIILVRDNYISSNNPSDYVSRRYAISMALKKEGYVLNEDYEIELVPNIVNITYGRDVGYKIEQERFSKDIESVSGTSIRNEKKENNTES